jgi:hypothetical protein
VCLCYKHFALDQRLCLHILFSPKKPVFGTYLKKATSGKGHDQFFWIHHAFLMLKPLGKWIIGFFFKLNSQWVAAAAIEI